MSGVKIWTETGGASEGPLLLLIHGMGANATVWKDLIPLIENSWQGGWMTLDLPGHGRSSYLNRYSMGDYAAEVARVLDQDREVAIVGHSMGGVVGFALSSGMFGLNIRSMTAIGIKTEWAEADFERAAAVAAKPSKAFPDRETAIDRYLKVSGLFGLVSADAKEVEVGIISKGEEWFLASDPRTNRVNPLDFGALAKVSRAPVHLLCGENDLIASTEGMEGLGFPVTTLAGCGHYPFVENAEDFWTAIEKHL